MVRKPKAAYFVDYHPTMHEEALVVGRKFRNLLRLTESRPFPYGGGFDGIRGDMAYELDWGRGWPNIPDSMLKAAYYKLALKKPLRILRYYALTNYPNLGSPATRVRGSASPYEASGTVNLYLEAKREARKLRWVTEKIGIELEVLPVKRVQRAKRA